MGYVLRSEYPAFAVGAPHTALRYDENADEFEGSDGWPYGWESVANDEGDVFDESGQQIGNISQF